MQEFDFTNRDGVNELSEMTEHLSHDEAAAAIAAIHATRDEKKILRRKTSKTGLMRPFFQF